MAQLNLKDGHWRSYDNLSRQSESILNTTHSFVAKDSLKLELFCRCVISTQVEVGEEINPMNKGHFPLFKSWRSGCGQVRDACDKVRRVRGCYALPHMERRRTKTLNPHQIINVGLQIWEIYVHHTVLVWPHDGTVQTCKDRIEQTSEHPADHN